MANHFPESEMIACSTREGSRALSSRREIRFEGDTSSSERSLEVKGAYVWRDEGCEEGRIKWEV